MSSKKVEKRHHMTFEKFKHVTDSNVEYWYARDLQVIFDYFSWDKFKRVIQKAISACEKSGQESGNHFSQVGKMVKIGSGGQRGVTLPHGLESCQILIGRS